MVAMINNVLLRGVTAVSELKARLSEERGQDLVEYALLSGLIALALIAALALGVYTSAVQAMAGGIKDCVDFNSLTDCSMG